MSQFLFYQKHQAPGFLVTVLQVYQWDWPRWGFDVSKWVTTAKPSAELELDPEPERKDEEGNVVTYFRTRFGVRYARVVEPTGFVMWLQEVE